MNTPSLSSKQNNYSNFFKPFYKSSRPLLTGPMMALGESGQKEYQTRYQKITLLQETLTDTLERVATAPRGSTISKMLWDEIEELGASISRY